MLKNREERKQFILNDQNWDQLYYIPEVETTIYQMTLPDGTQLYKYIVKEKTVNGFTESRVRNVISYRMKTDEYISNEISLSYIIDFLGKIKEDNIHTVINFNHLFHE